MDGGWEYCRFQQGFGQRGACRLTQAFGKVNAYSRENKNYFARFGMKQTFLSSIFATPSK
jgi:hypothetical protein